MSLKKIDPLLAIARIILIVLQALTALATVACVVAIPAIFLFQSQVLSELANEGIAPEAFTALAGILALAGLAVALIFFVARLLARIVATVGEGDPFVPENATRLSRMAWLILAVQLVGIPLTGMAIWLSNLTNDSAETAGDAFSISALLLVLILFILARVFRKGTEMREELEGTV